ncbi:MAG: iron-containing alcohol dehydrogenase [Pseudotabrizicola sp.]|uniref:iron-containing alcohol dehydrogenase n=1 Tax=Pseudotabrizicola sp. TaxID=2939647 RepID=UPI0027248BC5|nr:iron-containing alcohol dehydrogenase [Pseudotabrizicola sp.]MDO9637577.1 iron-containing alcohol dehydrogenase [Pseudotabrizicola sp.]
MSLITYLTRIHFADRVLEDALSEELRILKVHRPLVVTDDSSGIEDAYDRLQDAMPRGCTPNRVAVTAATGAVARSLASTVHGFACDAVLALGGAVALGLARRVVQGLPHRPGAPEWPLITIPMTTETVGLGPLPTSLAEAGPRLGTGKSRRGPGMVPTMVLCDPTLTLGAGQEATAAAGMDALTHCIEAYLGAGWNPPADGIALDGVRRAAGHLERAVSDGNDLGARRELLATALNAGLVTQKGLGAVHALAYAIEAETGSPYRHGWLHASILPPVLKFNAPAVGDRYDLVLQAMGAPPGASLSDALAALGARLSLPLCLGPIAADVSHRIARRAEEDPATRTNPRHITAADYQRMLEGAQR